MKRELAILVAMIALWVGCGELEQTPEPEVDPGETLAWMEAYQERYLGDRAWRRAQLEATLWSPELPYARKRLNSYALPEGGWDLLPELLARSGPVFPGQAVPEELEEALPTVFPTQAPNTREEWLALGEQVFWQMPMRRDNYLEWIATRPELLEETGFERNADGSLRGLVRFKDVRGQMRVGVTCGLCHGGGGVAGRTNTALDLGRARQMFNESYGIDGSRFASWGPGRVDITDDLADDPLRVPNLWGTRHQSYLNASGIVRVANPASVAIRFETQYIPGHGLEARPNRVLSWALAMYVLSLEPPASPAVSPEHPGRAVFELQCASCHNPDRGFSGDLIHSWLLTGGVSAAESPMRGTGMMKVPSLVGIGQGGPFMHDGRHAELRDVLEARHPTGAVLSAEERDDLLSYLQSL